MCGSLLVETRNVGQHPQHGVLAELRVRVEGGACRIPGSDDGEEGGAMSELLKPPASDVKEGEGIAQDREGRGWGWTEVSLYVEQEQSEDDSRQVRQGKNQ